MGGGAWPFLVGGAICLVNSVKERDLSLLTSYTEMFWAARALTDVFNESIALAGRPGLEKRPQRVTGPKSPRKGRREGESPVVPGPCRTTRRCLLVGLFGNAALIGRYIPSKAKYGRETDSGQVPRGKDEKDFEKRVKECLKLSGGKRMAAVDAPRSDVERREPVRRSAQGVDRHGSFCRPKLGPSIRPWRRRRLDCGTQHAPSRRASASACYGRQPTGSPSGPS
ncbi:hypothetical protein V6N13_023009 [Hibiscus sabdariffa]